MGLGVEGRRGRLSEQAIGWHGGLSPSPRTAPTKKGNGIGYKEGLFVRE